MKNSKAWIENDVQVRKIGIKKYMGSIYNKRSAGNCDETDFNIDNNDNEDADEINNDSDTSTSFSLQECMNEFRARRVRRSSLYQNRHHDKNDVNSENTRGTTELDLIQQNLCNKEQERKCKPCQNGFCYCFTSDSGDGCNLGDCHSSIRNFRRNKPSERFQNLYSYKKTAESPQSHEDRKEHSSHTPKSPTCKNSKKNRIKPSNRLTAISSLETGTRDAPIIHIIQELRNNCIISKVKVNKHKVQQFGKNISSNEKCTQTGKNKAQFKNKKKENKPILIELKDPYKYVATAPVLDKKLDLETGKTACNLAPSPSKTNKKYPICCKGHVNAGGQLLQKRLSSAQFNYKPRGIIQAPRKPPRTFLNYDKCDSSDSTSTSVREAERVVDVFLQKKSHDKETVDLTISNDIRPKIAETSISRNKTKRKSYPLTLKESTKQTENLVSAYPSLSDMHEIMKSENLPCLYYKNIRPAANGIKKAVSIGWIEPKVLEMLNFDTNTKQKQFHSTSTEAHPQQIPSIDSLGKEGPTQFQIPPKINLDTVDGVVHHNLASNLKYKNTPVKTKLISPSQKTKDRSSWQKSLWSEHLSPWLKKCNINDKIEGKPNLRNNSKGFINSSKKKLAGLISPKKEERCKNNVEKCNIGIQTSYNEVSLSQPNIYSQNQHIFNIQSPPGSYHSPMLSSRIEYASSTQLHNTTINGTESASTKFDFSQTVNSPPKKANRSSQRKLNFPLNCTKGSQYSDIRTQSESVKKKRTYRSFNSELDQDVSLSKISYILSNIRTKLEANDRHAEQTFLGTEYSIDHNLSGFDCTDGHQRNLTPPTEIQDNFNGPIYSEIEECSVYISERPNFGNKTGIQHIATDNLDMLYAKVNKRTLGTNRPQLKEIKPQTPLAIILQDSLKSSKILTKVTPLPTLPEPPESETTSYTLPLSPNLPLSQCNSLNNVREIEHNTLLKKEPNLNKSDLSLHRSEIFFENLCNSELVTESGFKRKISENIINENKNSSNISSVSMMQLSANDNFCISSESRQDLNHNDPVPYELLNEYKVDGFDKHVDVDNIKNTGDNLGLNIIYPPSTDNQSTPKKKSFVAKDRSITNELNVIPINISDNVYYSCPNTPRKQICDEQNPANSLSMNEIPNYEALKECNVMTPNTLQRYKSIKYILHKSFRKSKTFIKKEGKRLTTSLNLSMNKAPLSKTLSPGIHTSINSNLNLDALFSLNESADLSEQIARTVSLCRELPGLEVSMEMVEAERLLLLSARRQENMVMSPARKNYTISQKILMHLYIDDMYLPVLYDNNTDIFFNYFYIITFECGGVIKSTQSAECVNGSAVFLDNGIEFSYLQEMKQNAVKCNIFMLRLRKISAVSIESMEKALIHSSTGAASSKLSSSSLCTEIVSRFRLHASFTLDVKDFVPYEYVHQESITSDRICMRASSFCTLPLTSHTESTNLSGQLHLKGRAEVRAPKHLFEGFLNVQDPYKQHNWNRRWCTLDGIFLYVWQDKNSLTTFPLMSIDLRISKQNTNSPLTLSPRELCARPRSFCLQYKINIPCQDISIVTVFFAADTQENADAWLNNINVVFDFINKWF